MSLYLEVPSTRGGGAGDGLSVDVLSAILLVVGFAVG
jgi:hypothetical protein